MSLNIAYRLASTAFIASAAELVIPPVYPEPSPIGYRFFIFTDSYFPVRLILTGEDVLVSAPNNIAWPETNKGYSSSQLLNAFKSAPVIKSGKISFISADAAPILNEFLFKLTRLSQFDLLPRVFLFHD